MRSTCERENCGRPVYCRNLCRSCYDRAVYNGHISIVRPWTRRKSESSTELLSCRACGAEKPRADFSLRDHGARRMTICRKCNSARAAASAAKIKVGDERWLRRRNATLRRKYGVTLAQYDEMLVAQDNRCAICRVELGSGSGWKSAHLDHCHDTGYVRGILCGRCNTHLSWAERVGMGAIADYLAPPPVG